MPARKLPALGDKFGNWTFLGEYDGRKWKCQCSCGAVGWPNSCHLKVGVSVGCRSCRDTLRRTGVAKGKTYFAWTSLKARCFATEGADYHLYGSRGISVCAEWVNNFQAFAEHIGPPPDKRYTVDRIDNDRGYEPGNVRWALPKLQARNRRTNRWITIGEETLIATDWCKRTGIGLPCANYRVKRMGWTWEKAVTTPPLCVENNLNRNGRYRGT